AALQDWRSAGWPVEWPARCFLALAFVAHFFTVALVAALPVALAILAWPSRWLAGILAVMLSRMATLGVILDSIVFHLFRFHLNGMVWSLIREGNLGQELPLSPRTWFVAGLLVAVVLAGEIGLAIGTWRFVQKPHSGGVKLGLGLVLAAAACQLV